MLLNLFCFLLFQYRHQHAQHTGRQSLYSNV